MVIDLSAQKKGGTLSKLNLSDRETIAICIVKKYPLAKIGEILNRSTSSISREIKKHRFHRKISFYL